MTTTRLIQIQCPGCGAPIQHAPRQAIASCPFCDNSLAMVYEDERGRAVEFDSSEFWYAPFNVAKPEFERVLLEWLVAGDYTPDDVLRHAIVQDHAGIFVPFCSFRGSYSATFTAAAGFDRQEEYEDTRRRFQDGKWVNERVTSTRTVTDWRPMSGEARGDFHIFCSASRQVPGELVPFCEQTPHDTLVSLETQDEGLGDYLVEAMTIDEDTCFHSRAQDRLDEVIRDEVKRRIPGDRSRDERWDADVHDRRTSKVYLPFWIACYRYADRKYHFILDGRDPQRFFGEHPVDTERKKRVKELYRTGNIWGIVWLVIGVLGVVLILPTILALAIGLPGYLYLKKRANEKKRAILDESRAVREQARLAIQQRGGLALDDDSKEFAV